MEQNPDIDQRQCELLQLIQVCWRLSWARCGRAANESVAATYIAELRNLHTDQTNPITLRIAARRAALDPAKAAHQPAALSQGADYCR